MNRRDRILNNTALNGLGRFYDAAIGLALVAYIVPTIGLADYGLWALVAACTGYAALFDAGLGSAYGRFIAEYAARNQREKISAVVSTGLIFYAIFGALFVAAAWLAVDGVLFAIDRYSSAALTPERIETFRFLFRGSIVLFAVSNCLAPFSAVLTGLQRMGAANLLSAAASSVKLVATIVFLERGLGVRGLVFANAAVVLVLGCLTIIATFRVYPSLRLAPRHVSRATFASLFAFGWRTQFARLANLVMFETDVLVIALLLRNLELAALYRIGVELANKFRQAPGILVSALIPAAADFHARGETDTLRKLYIRATKYSAAIAIPLAAFGAGAAGPLLETWLGPIAGLTTAAGVLQVIVVGYIANIVPGAGVSIALGMGRADLQLRAGLISMFANVGLTIVLALSIGFWGIPLATAVSMAISWAWYGHAMGRLLDVPWMRMWTDALKWPCAVGVCTLVAVAAVVGVAGPIDGRMANGAIACGCALAGAAIVLAAMRWSPMLDDYDRSVFRRALDLPGEWMWKRMPRPG